MSENRTLAECALASARLFEAQQWQYVTLGKEAAYVPDAEKILEMLTVLVEHAHFARAGSDDQYGCSSSGRLRVEVGEDGVVEIWQNLGTIEGEN